MPPIIDAVRSLAPAKPVVFAGLDEGAAVPAAFVSQLRDLRVPYFPSPRRAFRAIARIAAMPQPGGEAARARGELPPLRLTSGTLAEYRAKELLRPWGIPFPEGRLARTANEALSAAAELGYPVVLKAQSVRLPHKSDAGGVILNVKDADSLTAAWTRMHDNIARSRPELALDGVLVERMSRPGVELIIGGRSDPDWGPLVLAGFGGVQAEILKDVRLLPPDLSRQEIVQELNLLKSGELLRGFRGSPPLDIPAVATIIEKIGALLTAETRIREIDLNPVIVYPSGSGAMALDALLVAGD
jgi:acyl-CoA synthetase (NDP forming)